MQILPSLSMRRTRLGVAFHRNNTPCGYEYGAYYLQQPNNWRRINKIKGIREIYEFENVLLHFLKMDVAAASESGAASTTTRFLTMVTLEACTDLKLQFEDIRSDITELIRFIRFQAEENQNLSKQLNERN